LRLLGANLQFAHGGPAGPAILVTSALPEEGKTTVVANLGAMLAVAGHDVVVVDADLRRPRLSKYLGVDATEGGLVDVLQRSTDLDRALRTVPLAQAGRNGRILTRTGRPITKRAIVAGLATERAGRLRLLASGGPTDESASLLTPAAVEDLIQDLRARCEFVVFDAAPLLVVADSFPLALKSDTIIVVARQGRTTRQSAQSVRNTLSGLGATNVSVVITDGSRPSGYAYPYLR
jgi:succinoglycan biosynthesis transport protein ExoP